GGWVSSFWNVVVCFLGGVVWVGLEVVRGVAFSGFGWNLLGVGLWRNVAMIQIAELTGVVGVSFVVVVVNLCFGVTVMRLVEELRSGRIRPHYDFALVVGGCALVFVFGVERLFRREESGVVERLRVAAVQANIPQEEKWDIAYERKILEKYERLTEYGMMVGPDLLAWPEAAMPRSVFSDREVYSFVMGLAKRMEGDFVFGTVHFDQSGDYNSIVLLGGVSKEPQFYHKIHLVPFGEFVPFRESFPLFAWIVGELVPSDFDAGRGVVVLKMERKDLRIGPLVCFEDTIGDLARRFVMGGADFFVNVTNDGWFRRSAGSEQHLAQAVFRCVENRVPMLRVANTGVTCWIDRWGRVVEKLTGEDGSTFV
ncbi:MAG: apolipoprotein N-acyltransferase, partial [Chthoniobacterales bacterium]|nr:apolipoprotein N-acyltransferase [Chthoniobacterales bacterium]